jgi:hypothetical protein
VIDLVNALFRVVYSVGNSAEDLGALAMVQVSEQLEFEEKKEKRRRMKKLEEIVESKTAKLNKQNNDEGNIAEVIPDTHSAEGNSFI